MRSGWSAKRRPQQAFYRGLGLGLLWLSQSVVSGGVNALVLQASPSYQNCEEGPDPFSGVG